MQGGASFRILSLLVVVASALIVIPIGMLLVGSFSANPLGSPILPSLQNYGEVMRDPLFWPTFANTMVFTTGSTLLALVVATFLAWAVVRTDMPGKNVAELMPIFPLLVPPMMDNIAWIFLLSPRAGILNKFLETSFGIPPLFDAFSMPAMIWVFGLSQVPLAYLIIVAGFAAMDPALEEAAVVSGSRTRRTFFRITFPLMMPAIVSAGILTFTTGLRAFETPTLQGIPAQPPIHVYVSRIYGAILLDTPPNANLATAYSVVLLALTIAVIVFYLWYTRRTEQFQVITGRGYRPHVAELGWARYLVFGLVLLYFLLAVAIPYAVVGLMSFMPFFSYTILAQNLVNSITLLNYELVLDTPLIREGLVTSGVMGVVSAGIALGLASMTSYLVYRTKIPGRRVLELIGTLPLAFPGLVLGIALLWTLVPVGLLGTPIALLFAFIVFTLPVALRATSSAILQIHSELEDASVAHGAGWGYTFRRITLPLLRPALVGAFLFLFLRAFREVGALLLLSGPGTTVAAVALFDYYGRGRWLELAAGSMLFAVLLLGVVLVGRFGLKASFRLRVG